MSRNQSGLIVGAFFALVHAVWSVAVAIIPAGLQGFLNWILTLHHISLPLAIMPFVLVNAVLLVIVTFIVGYIFGWLLGWLSELIGH